MTGRTPPPHRVIPRLAGRRGGANSRQPRHPDRTSSSGRPSHRPALWRRVRTALEKGDVEVILAPGVYRLSPGVRLDKLGDESHRPHPPRRKRRDGAILPGRSRRRGGAQLPPRHSRLQKCHARNLHFQGPGKIGVVRPPSATAANITIERCSWHDLPGRVLLRTVDRRRRHAPRCRRSLRLPPRRHRFHAHMIYAATEALASST